MNPDVLAGDGLTHEIEMSSPVQGSSRCELLHCGALGILPIGRSWVVASRAREIALCRRSAVQRGMGFDLVVDTTKRLQLIAHGVEVLRDSPPSQVVRHRSVESLDLALGLWMAHPGVDRPDSLLDQENRDPAEAI